MSYSIGYALGTIIAMLVFILPIAGIAFLIARRKDMPSKRRSAQPEPPLSYRRSPLAIPQTSVTAPNSIDEIMTPNGTYPPMGDAANSTSRSNRRQWALEKRSFRKQKAQSRKESKAANRELKAQKRLEQEAKERMLLERIEQLDLEYPITDINYHPSIQYECKSRREFESMDCETAAIKYIREHPNDIRTYERIRNNAQNQQLYEDAFQSEIAPQTTNRRLLRKRRRRAQTRASGSVKVTYSFRDKITREMKEDSKFKYVSMDKLFEDVKDGVVRESERQLHAQRQRALMSNSLRYDVLARDGFRCQICGATQEDGIKLHVDHIIPVSKGGETTMENLRVLCERCNLGKGAKIENASNNSKRIDGAMIDVISHNSEDYSWLDF